MSVRPKVFEFRVSLDAAGDVHSERGGSPLRGDERVAWTPEHLLVAALARCVLTSLRHHADRAGIGVTHTADAVATVTRRDDDGRYALTSATVDLDVRLDPEPAADERATLLAKAERDCWVGASLQAHPRYRWTINGREIG